MIGRLKTHTLLQRVLSLSSADETEAVLLGLESQLTRFANNGIHQHVAETNHYVVVRVAAGRRVGVGATNDLSGAGLEHVVEAATTAASLRPDDPDFLGLPVPVSVATVNAFDEATAGFGPTQRAELVRAVCRRAVDSGCVASGAFRTAIHETAVANSHDLFAYHPATEADMSIVMMTEDSSGFAADAHWKGSEVNAIALGDEAIEKARRGRNPQPLAPDTYPVVLESYAVADILNTLGRAAGANAVQEGRSWMSGRQGQRLMSSCVSIWDDGHDPTGWPMPFDFEGLPRHRVDIVRDGVVGEAVYDRARASKEGKASSGHALPATNPFNPWLNAARLGPVPLHLHMGPGDSQVADMIAGTERGLYVTRFWYTRTVHPRDAVVTGMTRDGTFLIERGELTTPVSNLRFTQSYVKALSGTEAVGIDARRMWTDPGMISAPALKLSGFSFTGQTNL